MTKKVQTRFKSRRRLFVREWREYRGLTQEELAERTGMSVSNISQLERGVQGYSQEGLEAIADALQCEPGHLHMVDPSRGDGIWSLWQQAAEGERRETAGYLAALIKHRSGGR